MKKYTYILFILGLIIIVIALIVTTKNNHKQDGMAQDLLSNTNSVSDDLSDDIIFDDGSEPTTWETAGITDPIAFKKFLLTLQTAVLNRDVDFVVSSLDSEVFNRQESLENYDKLFSPSVVDAFQKINIHQIWRNYKGAEIGNGTVWFKQNSDGTFSIQAINQL